MRAIWKFVIEISPIVFVCLLNVFVAEMNAGYVQEGGLFSEEQHFWGGLQMFMPFVMIVAIMWVCIFFIKNAIVAGRNGEKTQVWVCLIKVSITLIFSLPVLFLSIFVAALSFGV